jgi:excisionase family DNA binding protein
MTSIAPRSHLWRGVCAAASLLGVLIGTADAAAGAPPCEQAVLTLAEAATLLRVDARDVERLAERGHLPARRVGRSWRFNCAALMDWLTGESVTPLTPPAMAAATATGLPASQDEAPPPASGPPAAAGQERPVGEAPEERPAEDIFLRGQRVLLGRGDVVVDVGQFYSRSDDHFIASVSGGVGLATSEQQAFTTLLLGRLGIFSETELFASTTFHRLSTRQFIGSTLLASSRRSELGDVQVGVRRTLVREALGRPDIVVSLSGSIPTGDTPYTASAGLVLVKSVDPVVLFASGNYVRAFSRRALDVSRPWAEQRWDLSVGYGLALNDTLTMSMAVSGVFTGATTLDRSRTRQPDVFSGRLGVTSWLRKGLYIEPSVSFALNGPADSFAFAVTMPYAF